MIDAGFKGHDGTTYIFSGRRYARLTTNSSSWVHMHLPGDLEGRFKDLPDGYEKGIDAALFHSPNGTDQRLYLFRGDKCTRFKYEADKEYYKKDQEPRALPGFFKSMPEGFKKGIDAAVAHDDGYSYFFAGSQCGRVKHGTVTFEDSGPIDDFFSLAYPELGVDSAFRIGSQTFLVSGQYCQVFEGKRRFPTEKLFSIRSDELSKVLGELNLPPFPAAFAEPPYLCGVFVDTRGAKETPNCRLSIKTFPTGRQGPGDTKYKLEGNKWKNSKGEPFPETTGNRGQEKEDFFKGPKFFPLRPGGRIQVRISRVKYLEREPGRALTERLEEDLTIDHVMIREVGDTDKEKPPLAEIKPGESVAFPKKNPDATAKCTKTAATFMHTHTPIEGEMKYLFGIRFRFRDSRPGGIEVVYDWDPEVRDDTGN